MNTTTEQKFAPVLRRVLDRYGVTPTNLARAVGVSPQRITNLLSEGRGARDNPNWLTVQRIADALGISTDELRTIPRAKKNGKSAKNKSNGVDK